MIRRLPVLAAAIAWGLFTALPAHAATPAFEFDVSSTADSIVVTVTFEPVPVGFAWADMEASGVFDELVGVLPADLVDQTGRPVDGASPVLMPLRRVGEGVYEGELTVGGGRWAVLPWPLVPGFAPDADPGAAPTAIVTVGAGTPFRSWLPLAALGVLAALGGSIWFWRRRRPNASRRHHPTSV